MSMGENHEYETVLLTSRLHVCLYNVSEITRLKVKSETKDLVSIVSGEII